MPIDPFSDSLPRCQASVADPVAVNSSRVDRLAVDARDRVSNAAEINPHRLIFAEA